MKTKFQNFNLGEVEVLSQAEQAKVKGGYPPNSSGGGGGGGWNAGSYCVECGCNNAGSLITWSTSVTANGGFLYSPQSAANDKCKSMGSSFSPICSVSATATLCPC